MMRTSQVEPLEGFLPQYDAVLAALGYERRSRFACDSLSLNASLKACCGFVDGHVLSYQSNHEWFEKHGYSIEMHDNDAFPDWVSNVLQAADDIGTEQLRILVDISSQTRYRLAVILDALMSSDREVDFIVDFVYALAEFSEPPREASVIATAGPVLDRFAGWSSCLELPVSVVVGAGYEPDKVIGVMEYLEPNALWICIPHDKDERFLDAIEQANASLWDSVLNDRRISYSLMAPYETFVRLESLCFGLMRSSRPVLIPFGPKMFALISMLVALHWPDELSVWRVSGEGSDTPVECEAEGTLVGLRVKFCRTLPRESEH